MPSLSFAKAATRLSLNFKGGGILFWNMAVKGALFCLKCKTFDSRWHWLARGIEFNFYSMFCCPWQSGIKDIFPFNKNFDLKLRKFHVANNGMMETVHSGGKRPIQATLRFLFLYLWARFVLGTTIFPAVKDISVRRTSQSLLHVKRLFWLNK